MILYKNNNFDNPRLHNFLEFDFIIKTKKLYIECCVNDNFQVISISYTERRKVKKYDEYEMTLDECYEIIAFAKNMKVVIGLEILVDNAILSAKAITLNKWKKHV
tara:strand:+ start:806 stop:1120 length:315 start_codon:yes stop_codon:yes gene_type:complete